MAGSQFAGAWKRATLPVSRVPRKPEIDPEHANPTDAPDPQHQDLTGAPFLPDEWSGGSMLQEFVPSAYVDMTPVSHEDGTGFLPGVDQATAQAIGGRARSEDLGAMDARDIERPQYQEDGSGHGEIVHADLAGTSPQTLQFLEKGIGVALDPHARRDRRITRRPTGPAVYDMRWYGEEMRPRLLKTAQGSRVRDAVPGRQVNTPTEGAGRIMRPDNWAAPIIRRSSAQWDQSSATDAEVPDPSGNFGLGSWGL